MRMVPASRLAGVRYLAAAASACIAGVLASSGVLTPADGRLGDTAAMAAARAAHTATALPDGRVLVAGGFTNEQNAAHGAQVYDAARARFSALPRMVTLRHSHSATLLANGKVLIAGGFGPDETPMTGAELFDPSTGTFSATGSMRAARAGHVAVSLADGRILLAGGLGPEWTFLASAELYDPANGTFSPTGSMTTARESHVAVRLQDERVLVVGGHRGRRAAIELYTSTEIYDPASGNFSRSGEMRVRRHKHDAVLLRDGRVLVTGGSDERDSDGVYNSTELFDPRSATFQDGPDLLLPRYKHQGSSLLVPDGRVLLVGGAPQAELFNPVSNSFTIVAGEARMAGQFSAAALLPNGAALITGGYGDGSGPRATTWAYRP